MFYIQKAVTRSGTRTVIDVGAAHGTKPLYRRFPDADLILVDPLKENEPDLQRWCEGRRGSVHITALGSSEGTLPLQIDRLGLTRTSALTRTALTERAEPDYENRKVPMTTLDALLADRPAEDPLGLKIDTEGYELEVLKGAEKTLTRCSWVITETSIAERFEGGYRFHELILHLSERGFELANILYVSRRKKVAKYCDLLFTARR